MKYKQVNNDNFSTLASLIHKNAMYVRSSDSVENFLFEKIHNKLVPILFNINHKIYYNLFGLT